MFSKTKTEEEVEEVQAEETEAQVVFPTLTHQWRARGQEVYCTTCTNTHGFTLPLGTKLVGENNGVPMLEKVFDTPAEA